MSSPDLAYSEYRCPSCGCALQVKEGQRHLTCPHCHSPLLAIYDHYLPRYYFADNIGRQGAIRKIRLALGNKKVSPKFASQAKAVNADLWWVPVYLFDGAVKSLEEHPRKKWKINYFSYYHSAVTSSPFGFEDVEAGQFKWPETGTAYQPLDVEKLKKSGNILLPQQEEEEIEQALLKKWLQGGLKQTELLSLQKIIIYLPFWVVRIEADGHQYSMVVGGIDGTIHRGSLPAKRCPGLGLCTSAALAGFILGFIFTKNGDGLSNLQVITKSVDPGFYGFLFFVLALIIFFSLAYFFVVTKCYFTINWHSGTTAIVRHGPPDPLAAFVKEASYNIKRLYGKWE